MYVAILALCMVTFILKRICGRGLQIGLQLRKPPSPLTPQTLAFRKKMPCRKYFKDHDLHETVCVKCVRDAVSIVEQMLYEESTEGERISRDSALYPRAIRMIASRLLSTSASVVAQLETLIRIAVFPCQTVPPHQHVPSA